jgi:hypothetical protein
MLLRDGVRSTFASFTFAASFSGFGFAMGVIMHILITHPH